jgi:hypothetical protein
VKPLIFYQNMASHSHGRSGLGTLTDALQSNPGIMFIH